MLSIRNVYISNILFYPMLLMERKEVVFNKTRIILFCIFEVIVVISTVLFIVQFRIIRARTFIQFFFTSQYFLFAASNLPFLKKLEETLKVFSIILSLYIILQYFLTGSYVNFSYESFLRGNRMWGDGLIPRWPNVIPLSLVFGLWLELKNQDSKWYICSPLFIASFLTTSRIGIIGSSLILLYFAYHEIQRQAFSRKIIISGVLLVCFIGGLFFLFSNQDILIRLVYMGDRSELWNISFRAILQRPILGYGGNTLDVYAALFPVDEHVSFMMQHTHNIFLEIALRYGFLGMLIFLLLIGHCYLDIKQPHYKFMFFLLIIMSLFQIFIRDFVFIIYLLVVINNGKEPLRYRTHCD